MKYSDEIIQRVKDASDIVAVVGEHVQLKKAGSSYKGLCPFHNEKTPSFMVSPSRNSFHCFGCGKGGNAITFLMEVERLSFPEALRLLAEKAGIELPKPQEREEDREGDRLRERLIALNEFAAKFFQEKLFSAEGQAARDYFKGRGYNKEDAVKFLIGYAPDGWESLKISGQKAGFSQEEMLAAGLIVHKEEKNSFYDKFRNRLIFPVKNNYDKILGFGGRALGEDPGPKYLNSPETLLFKKGENLYLLESAREAIRQKGFVTVVEGYFDALALHHHGFENTVATLGTALTSQHGRILKRYTQEVVFSYDADEAGQAAVARGFEPLAAAGLQVRVLVMPDGKDPDEFLQKHKPDELKALMDKAPDYFRWWAASIRGKTQGQPVEQRVRALAPLVPVIAGLGTESQVQSACSAVESEMGLDNRDFLALVNEARKKGVRRPAPEAPNPKGEGSPDPQKVLDAGHVRIEAEFLVLLNEENGDFIPWAKDELAPEVFEDENFRRLFEELCSGERSVKDLGRIPELQGAFLRIEEQAKKGVREAMLGDLAAALKKRLGKKKMAELKARQMEAEKAGRTEESLALAQEWVLVKRQYQQEVEPK
jgi:DNA primase